MSRRLTAVGVVVSVLLVAGAAVAASNFSFGVYRDKTLAGLSQSLYGFGKPLAQSSSAQVSASAAQADPTSLVKLAGGLTAHVVSTQGGANADQITLWPNSTNPKWLIACNESDPTEVGVERINIASGVATTIATGTADCDPTRRTPWGTVLFGEEAGGGPDGGRIYELIDPLHTTGVTLDRSTGTFSGGTGAGNLVARSALGRAAFEGLAILPDGTTYTDPDDSSQGPKDGRPGNSFYKFIPDNPVTPGDPPITDLADSPYASGQVFGLRISGTGTTGYGQGREFGLGRWIELPDTDDLDLEEQTVVAGLTGYYRLEDADLDGRALNKGLVRFCAPSTGDEASHLFGEVVCVSDGTIGQAEANTATPEAQAFVFGGTSKGVNMPDNIAFQPGRGNWVVHEDASTTFGVPHNNDLWDCLPDGPDQDLLSDGCVRIASLNDLTAEWTGGIFDASGTHFYVSVQHNISGEATILDITGWT